METRHKQGENLALLLNRSKIKKGDLAEMLGVSDAWLSKLQKKDTISEDIKLKACSIFGVTMDFFDSPIMGDMGEMTSEETAQMIDRLEARAEELKKKMEKMEAALFKYRQIAVKAGKKDEADSVDETLLNE